MHNFLPPASAYTRQRCVRDKVGAAAEKVLHYLTVSCMHAHTHANPSNCNSSLWIMYMSTRVLMLIQITRNRSRQIRELGDANTRRAHAVCNNCFVCVIADGVQRASWVLNLQDTYTYMQL
jgi:hypothetical protein